MEKMIKKIYENEVKEVNDEERSVVSYITTNDIDRDNEIVLPEGMVQDKYEKNPVVLWRHDHSTPAIGTSLWRKQDGNGKGIIAKTKFASTPFAQDIYTLVKEGVLKAWSIGFRIKEKIYGDNNDEPVKISKWELIEYSICNVGCNPEALTLAYEKGLIKDKATIKALEINNEEGHKPEPEVTENYIRIRIKDPGLFADGSMRTIVLSADQGIHSVIGKLKSDPSGPTHIQSMLFEKAKWTVETAQAWVAEHKPKSCEFIETADGSKGVRFLLKDKEVDFIYEDSEKIVYKIDMPEQKYIDLASFVLPEPKEIPGISADDLKKVMSEVKESLLKSLSESVRREIRYLRGEVD